MIDTRRLERGLKLFTGRQDLLLVSLLVLAIFMMILPLPTLLVDTLIAINIGMTIIILMVGIYLRDPLQFSTLPSVILLLTVFRLALSITTTRLILVQADAGRIVETFGSFVVAGNLIVGLVVFLIITIVQFVVITKGAERIAEVSARFSLDALPGKQMSIDSDLRSGLIDVAEARRKRDHLQRESQLYGAMDGAMKFVKGDAIAGLVIIAVNLLGGIAVGTLQQDMELGSALQIYALLTVGDGLISQIPALFVSITSGTIVTRVVSDESENLGADISAQLVAEPKTLRLAGVVMAAFAFVPGFPMPIFLFLSAVLGGCGLLFYFRDRRAAKFDDDRAANILSLGDDRAYIHEGDLPVTSVIVTMRVGSKLKQRIDGSIFRREVEELRRLVFDDLGVILPAINLEFDTQLEPDGWSVVMESVPIGEGVFNPDQLWIRDEPTHLELAEIPFQPTRGLVAGRDVLLVEIRWRERLDDAGIAYMDATATAVWLLGRTLVRYASEFVGINETRTLLSSLEPRQGELVKEALKVVPLRKTAEILRRLVSEGVPIRNMRPVLEALVDWGQREQDVALLSEYVRGALKRQICFRHINGNRMMPVFMLDPPIEEAIRQAIRHTSVGSYLTLDKGTADLIIEGLRHELASLDNPSMDVVVLAATDTRRFVRSLVNEHGIELAVLSYQELTPEITVQPVATIELRRQAGEALVVGAPALAEA